jgi:hypothetical protein
MSFRGKPIRKHENDNNNAARVSTIQETRQLLSVLLKILSECSHREEHISALREAIVSEELVAMTTAELMEAETRERLLE